MMKTVAKGSPERDMPAPAWKNPATWLAGQRLSRGFWIFFSAAFFFDAGFAVYVFLFNLFLLDCHYNERVMGWIGGAMTLGSVLGTLPAGVLVRRHGIRLILLTLFIAAPSIAILRALWTWEPAQIALALFEGLAMSSWGVCFLPAIARLTTQKNRTFAFSLIFSVSIGTGILGGVVCGYLGQWLSSAGIILPAIEVKRIILLASSLIVFVGLIPVLKLEMPADTTEADQRSSFKHWYALWKLSPFLARFLPSMALWCAIIAAFTPFANIYLSRQLHISMRQIGLLFSAAQLIQLGMGFITPLLFRLLGLIRGIAITQVVAAVTLALLSDAQNAKAAIALYLIFSAAQWISSPGLYNLLMDETADKDRSTSAAMTLFCNALAGSAATALAGMLFARFGYPPVLLGIAAAALIVAIFFFLLISSAVRKSLPLRSGASTGTETHIH